MTPKLREAYKNEMAEMLEAYVVRDFDLAFHHLERAHILGQRNFGAHLRTHWWMLKIGFIRKDFKEVFGQTLRMLAVLPASIFGWVPVGNTGGANVSPLATMPIPNDLIDFFVD